jgi:hypothetical protein
MFIETFQFLNVNPWVIVVAMLWVLPWKGYALWKAARGKHNFWFIALFLLNTLAVLDILYIFVFSKMHKKKK